MNDLAIFAITLIGVGALLIAKTITIVSQSDIYVIERLGKYTITIIKTPFSNSTSLHSLKNKRKKTKLQ